jgi:hypothetical protein
MTRRADETPLQRAQRRAVALQRILAGSVGQPPLVDWIGHLADERCGSHDAAVRALLLGEGNDE